MDPNTPLHERIAALAGELTRTEADVAGFMAANPALVAVSSTAELAELTSTSDGTVIRTTKKLGYPNFRELRRSALAVSGRYRDPSKVLDDALDQITSADLGARKVLRDTAELLTGFEADLDASSWERAVAMMSSAGRVVTYGIGMSAAPADYLAIGLNRSGVPSTSVTATGLALADHVLGLGERDVVVLFATLRRFREIDVVIDLAAKAGAKTVLVTETQGEALRDRVDVVLATPSTITGTSDGVVMGMVVACALRLSVAAEDHSSAVATMERLNAVRAEIVGGAVDSDR